MATFRPHTELANAHLGIERPPRGTLIASSFKGDLDCAICGATGLAFFRMSIVAHDGNASLGAQCAECIGATMREHGQTTITITIDKNRAHPY